MTEIAITIFSIVVTILATFFPLFYEKYSKSRAYDRRSRRGAWQMVEDISQLDHLEQSEFTKNLRSTALKRAIRAEALALTRSPLWAYPTAIGAYAAMAALATGGVLIIGLLAFVFFLVYVAGTIFLTTRWLQARQLNRDKGVAIDFLIEQEDPRIVDDPGAAVSDVLVDFSKIAQKRHERRNSARTTLRHRIRRLRIRERDVARREREADMREQKLDSTRHYGAPDTD